MKNLKLFHKIFLCSFFIMLLVVIISHELLYFLSMNISLNHIDNGYNSTMEMVADFPLITQISFQSDEYISKVIRTALPYSIAVSFIISLIFSLILSKIISSPIRRICNTTIKMSTLDKSAKSNEFSCYEISLLSQNINSLYTNLLSTIENLELEKRKVCEIEEQKIDFLRVASHELKTPITSLNLILENMILKVGTYKNPNIYLPKCKQITEQLAQMICNILDTSKINSFVEEDKAPVNISSAIIDIISSYSLILQSKGTTIMYDIKTPIVIYTYSKLFTNALSNIISNAIFYTECTKHIIIKLTENELVIENECTPLSPEHLKHIFEPFYRPEFSRYKNSDGNGLGLYFVSLILTYLNYNFSFLPVENEKMQFKIFFHNLL